MKQLTTFQKKVFAEIRKHAGEDSRFLALCLNTSAAAFNRAAHQLMRRSLVYYDRRVGRRKDWWPT